MMDGFFLDGKSSQKHSAKLGNIELGSVTLRLSDKEILINAVDIKISSRLGNSARYIQLGELGKFETRDNDAADTLSLQLNQRSGFLHTLETNIGLIVLAALVTLLMGWATMKYGVPSAADAIVNALPEKTSDYLEKTIVNRVEKELFQPSKLSEERQAELHNLFTSVSAQLGIAAQKYAFKIRLAEDGIGANALAFPNGTIIMTDQLIKLSTSDKQIAGVMAHELGHLDAKHSLRQIVRGSIFTFLIAFITGDVSGASSAVLSAPAIFMELKYSREFESNADDYAIRYFDCDIEGLRAMGEFFIAMSAKDDKTLEKNHIKEANEKTNTNTADFLSTHPGSRDRQTKLENHIKQHCIT